MARFGELVPTSGRYINAADKAMLAADPDAEKADERADNAGGPVALRLMRSTYQPRAQFGPRWLVDCRTIADGEDIAVDFAAADKAGTPIEARQAMFAELRDRLDAGEAFEPVILVRVAPTGKGNPFWTFADAPAELVAQPMSAVWIDDDDAEPEPVKPGRAKLSKAR